MNPDTTDNRATDGIAQRIAGSAHTAIQYAICTFLSFSLAISISAMAGGPTESATIGAMWAMISAIVVTQETRTATIDTAWLRILGSLIGASVSAAYLLFLPFSAAGMAILIGITVLACQLLGIPGHARLAALTAGVVMVVSSVNPAIPALVNAGTRFAEVIIGSSIAVAVAWALQYVAPASGKPS